MSSKLMSTRKRKVFLFSNAVDCHRRSLDASKLLNYFKLNSIDVVNEPHLADYIILITCAFSEDRESQGIKLVQNFLLYNKKLVVVCCLPGVALDRLNSSFSATFISTKNLNDIDGVFEDIKVKFNQVDDANFHTKFEPIPLEKSSWNTFISGLHSFLGLPRKNITRFIFGVDKRSKSELSSLEYLQRSHECPNLRISGGCLGNCAYCAIRNAIGPLKSKPLKVCLNEYKKLLSQGHREFTFTADDLGAYGLDIKSSFPVLLNELSKLDHGLDVTWYFLELNPRWALKYKDELIKIIKTGKVKGLLLPIQSGSERILNLMNRQIKTDDLKNMLAQFNKANPKMVISSHFIVGFPTETDNDFKDTLNLVKENKIHPLFIPYSERRGTISEKLYPKVDSKSIKKRMDLANMLFPEI